MLKPAQREFYTVKEIAGMLGFSTTSIYDMASNMKRRKILPPFIRIGTKLRFPSDEYERWKKDGLKNV